MHVLSKCKECYIMSCHSIVCYANCRHCGLYLRWRTGTGFCALASVFSPPPGRLLNAPPHPSCLFPPPAAAAAIQVNYNECLSVTSEPYALFYILFFYLGNWRTKLTDRFIPTTSKREIYKHANTYSTYNTIHKKD